MSNKFEYIENFTTEEQKGLEKRGLSSSFPHKKIRLGDLFGYEFTNINNDKRRLLYNQAFEKQTHLLQEKGIPIAPFIFGNIDSNKIVYCVEGESDGIALSNFTENIISFCGANSTNLSKLQEQMRMNFIGSDTFGIVFDNDPAGRKGAEELKKQILHIFPNSNVKIIDISKLCHSTKDLREGLYLKKSFSFNELDRLASETLEEDSNQQLIHLIADSEKELPKLPIAYDPDKQNFSFSIMKLGEEKERLLLTSSHEANKKVEEVNYELFEKEDPKDIPYVMGLKSETLQTFWQSKQDGKKLYQDIKAVFHGQIHFNDHSYLDIHTSYVLMTYIYPVFPTVPYLHINGNKHCGKSQLSHIHSDLTFNAMESTSSTMAAIRRLVHHDRGTIVFDDFERACNSENEEIMTSMLNAGYTTRSKSLLTNKDSMKANSLFIGGPKIFNSINKIDPVLASRCIINKMVPAPSDFVRRAYRTQNVLKSMKSQLVLWALENHGKVSDEFSKLKRSTSREEELYNPLLAIVNTIFGSDSAEFHAISKVRSNHMVLQGQRLGLNEIVLDEIHYLWSEKKPNHTFDCFNSEIYESVLSRDDLPSNFHKNRIKDSIEAFHICLDHGRKLDKFNKKMIFYKINVPAMLSAWKALQKPDVQLKNDFN